MLARSELFVKSFYVLVVDLDLANVSQIVLEGDGYMEDEVPVTVETRLLEAVL